MLKQEGMWSVGNGVSLDLRNDNWLASGNKAKVLDSSHARVVSECINASPHFWDHNLLA